MNRIKNLDFKQFINQTCNIVSTNKSWKQFKKIKKRNYKTLSAISNT